MKLKAPPGVGDPCIAGVAIAARDGLYEVEAEIAALLIEAFGFVPADAAPAETTENPAPATGTSPRRRGRPPGKKI